MLCHQGERLASRTVLQAHHRPTQHGQRRNDPSYFPRTQDLLSVAIRGQELLKRTSNWSEVPAAKDQGKRGH
jgi:hypothetical protein